MGTNPTSIARLTPLRGAERCAPAPRTGAECAVCESPEIETDEVFDRGLWLLAECGRCGHRWTAGPFGGPTPTMAQVRPVKLVEGLVGVA